MINFRRVILARSVQRFETKSPTRYLPELLQSLVARFGFAGFPKELDLAFSDPPKAIELRHGRFVAGDGRQVVIEKLDLYNDGAITDTVTSTDDVDAFAVELLKWTEDEKFEIALIPPRLYLSQLELEIDGGLERWASAFANVS